MKSVNYYDQKTRDAIGRNADRIRDRVRGGSPLIIIEPDRGTLAAAGIVIDGGAWGCSLTLAGQRLAREL